MSRRDYIPLAATSERKTVDFLFCLLRLFIHEPFESKFLAKNSKISWKNMPRKRERETTTASNDDGDNGDKERLNNSYKTVSNSKW